MSDGTKLDPMWLERVSGEIEAALIHLPAALPETKARSQGDDFRFVMEECARLQASADLASAWNAFSPHHLAQFSRYAPGVQCDLVRQMTKNLLILTRTMAR